MEKTHQKYFYFSIWIYVLFNEFLKEPKITYCLERNRGLLISCTEEINFSDYNERWKWFSSSVFLKSITYSADVEIRAQIQFHALHFILLTISSYFTFKVSTRLEKTQEKTEYWRILLKTLVVGNFNGVRL